MFDLFSDIFARQDNAVSRMDPRCKMVIALGLIFAVILSSRPILPLAVSAFSIAVMLLLGIPGRIVLLRLTAPIGIVTVLVALQSFMTGGTPLVSFRVANWVFTATHEGLSRGLLMGARVLGSVSVVLLLGFVTPAYNVFNALRWFGVPEGWVEIAVLVYRYSFTLLDQTGDVAEAQSTRLGYSSVRRSIASVGVLAGTVMTRSIDQALRTYEAMVLRGYRGRLPFGPFPALRRSDLYPLMVAMPIILACYLFLEW